MKQCTKCGETKPLDEFWKRKKAAPKHQGRHQQCAACMRGWYNNHRQENLTMLREQEQAWLAKAPAHYGRDSSRRYRARHGETLREKEKEYRRAYNRKNPDAYHLYYLANRDRFLERAKERKARRKGADGDGHTLAELHEYWRAEGMDPSVCTYCDESWEGWKTSAGDHVVPLSKGGADKVDNLVPCCRSCNSSKNDRLLHVEWTPPNMRLRNVS